jgi:NADPH:quinone reductase-like Zn-dependent oxidoreductase
VAGVVDTLGSKVDTLQTGDRVFAKTSLGQGGYAEYAVTSASQAAVMPKIGFIEAAAIPTAGLAAWPSLFDISGLEGDQVCAYPWRRRQCGKLCRPVRQMERSTRHRYGFWQQR